MLRWPKVQEFLAWKSRPALMFFISVGLRLSLGLLSSFNSRLMTFGRFFCTTEG